MSTAEQLATVLHELAHTLLSPYEVADILDRLCDSAVDILPVDGAGVLLLEEQEGESRLVTAAASDARIHHIERLQLKVGEGPCLQAWTTGEPVVEPDLAGQGCTRWPAFAPAAAKAGMGGVHSFPMRVQDQRIGALNLFSTAAAIFSEDDGLSAQLLADVATIYVVSTRERDASARLSEQLRTALESRVVIEQAKGVLAERHGIDVDQAFDMLRRHARATRATMRAAAGAIIDGSLQLGPDGIASNEAIAAE